ncbi:MAG TPA: TolC family protein, partial [Cyclobacteriaceae bacterium]|nr:TolC family protein [Cyclobacteriaceae bacterium]
KKYNAQRKEAAFMQQSARYNKEAVQLDLLAELENLLFEFESNNQRLNLFSEQMEITQQTIRLMLTAYSTGSTNMEEILRQRQALIGYRQQQLNALTAQHVSVSAISTLMGTDNY